MLLETVITKLIPVTGPQDQVDTMTFQNRSLRDRAKRFEEALRRSTDEQIVVTAARYSTGPLC